VKFELLRRPRACTDANGEVHLAKQSQLLLALLVLAEGPVDIRHLSEQLWEGEDNPPTDPVDRLYRVKKDLTDALEEAEPAFPGVRQEDRCYRIPVSRQQVDVFRFHDHVCAAKAAGRDDAQAVRLWRTAISEWGPYRPGQRPVPLAGLPGLRAELLRNGLQAEYRDVLIRCHKAELRLGRHVQLIPELTALLSADEASRQDEELAYLLMLACYRAGRRDAARTTFRQLRDGLRDIGLEPSARLTRLYERIRTGDPALDLMNGAPMSVADHSLDETLAAEETPDPQPSASDDASSAGPGAVPDAGPGRADQAKAEAEERRGRLFGDVFQLGDNATSNQAYEQKFYESPEGT
jgi:transcriptional activator